MKHPDERIDSLAVPPTRPVVTDAMVEAGYQGWRDSWNMHERDNLKNRLRAVIEAAFAAAFPGTTRPVVDASIVKRAAWWATYLAPVIEDDNVWYSKEWLDGKDAGEIGEILAAFADALEGTDRE